MDHKILFVLFGLFTLAAAQCQLTGSANPNAPLLDPDNGGTPVSSDIVINLSNPATVATSTDSIIVTLVVQHTYNGDLEATLTSPGGTTIDLIRDPGTTTGGFGCPDDGFDITLIDSASTPVENCGSGGTVTGSVSPNDPLSTFNTENALGTWTLTIADSESAGTDEGTFVSWSITIDASTSGSCVADPHFKGFLGQEYDVHGVPNASMAIYSDTDVHVNALVQSPLDPSLYHRGHQVTIMTKIGALFADLFTLECGVYPQVYFKTNPELKKTTDNNRFAIPRDQGYLVEVEHGVEVHFADRYVIEILAIQDDVNPEQRYLNINVHLTSSPASEFTHGLLGQTLHNNSIMSSTGPNGEGLIDGKITDYIVSSLWSSDFLYTTFEARVVDVVDQVSLIGGASSTESLYE